MHSKAYLEAIISDLITNHCGFDSNLIAAWRSNKLNYDGEVWIAVHHAIKDWILTGYRFTVLSVKLSDNDCDERLSITFQFGTAFQAPEQYTIVLSSDKPLSLIHASGKKYNINIVPQDQVVTYKPKVQLVECD